VDEECAVVALLVVLAPVVAEVVDVVVVAVVVVVVEVVVAVSGSPITIGVPVRAETGMSPHTVPRVEFEAGVAEMTSAWVHEPLEKKSISVFLPMYELEMQTCAVPPVSPDTLTS